MTNKKPQLTKKQVEALKTIQAENCGRFPDLDALIPDPEPPHVSWVREDRYAGTISITSECLPARDVAVLDCDDFMTGLTREQALGMAKALLECVARKAGVPLPPPLPTNHVRGGKTHNLKWALLYTSRLADG